MGDVALEIPLGPLALVRGRQRRDAADARVQTLGDTLDNAALPGRIAAFEKYDHLELVVDDPILELHQFALQPEQLLEIDSAIQGYRGLLVGKIAKERCEAVVIQLHLQLLIEAVG
jgi:hypothetical protein